MKNVAECTLTLLSLTSHEWCQIVSNEWIYCHHYDELYFFHFIKNNIFFILQGIKG